MVRQIRGQNADCLARRRAKVRVPTALAETKIEQEEPPES